MLLLTDRSLITQWSSKCSDHGNSDVDFTKSIPITNQPIIALDSSCLKLHLSLKVPTHFYWFLTPTHKQIDKL